MCPLNENQKAEEKNNADEQEKKAVAAVEAAAAEVKAKAKATNNADEDEDEEEEEAQATQVRAVQPVKNKDAQQDLKKEEAEAKTADFSLQNGSEFLCKAFNTQYPEIRIKKKNGHNVLTFPSVDVAQAFFTKQAKEINSQPFLVQKYENDKPMDDYHFSVGTGRLFSGTKESIMNALREALNGEGVNREDKQKISRGIEQFNRATMITSDYRGAVTTGREEQQKQKQEQEQPAAPSPLPGSSSTGS